MRQETVTYFSERVLLMVFGKAYARTLAQLLCASTVRILIDTGLGLQGTDAHI